MDIKQNLQDQQFIDWLIGKKVRFPFLKDMPKIPEVIMFRKTIKQINKKYGTNKV